MCLSPITIVNPRYKGKSGYDNRALADIIRSGLLPYPDFTLRVPCGHCAECLSSRRADFAFRLISEFERSYKPVFITLTYSDEYLPSGRNLSKDDAKRFVKYMSNHLPFKYVYYLCGEYGDIFGRPHYHVCVLPLEDNDFDWFTFLESAWYPCITDVLPLNKERCAYCCKYSVKQLGCGDYDGRVPPFHLFSKSLGKSFLTSDLIKSFQHSQSFEFEGRNLPRYYRDKIFPKHICRLIGERNRQEYEFKRFIRDNDGSLAFLRYAELNKVVNSDNKEASKVLKRNRH